MLALSFAFFLGRLVGPAGVEDEHSAHTSGDETVWTCSMHPQVRQPEPGACPICGMDLIPQTTGTGAELADNQVSLSTRARTLASIRTTRAERLAPTGTSVRLLGRIDYDETTLQTVTAWTGGRIDRLHVSTTGERVRRGQIIASLYSPEVYAANQDLITAGRQLHRLRNASELSRSTAASTLASARQRLTLLGVPESTIRATEQLSQPPRNCDIRSPFAGTILERLATEGAYVETGTPLYRIADLTRLWIQLDAYESDLPHITVGQTVDVLVDGIPGEPLVGRVTFIDPLVDAARRTARVRVEVSNVDRRLRPGMFVEATIQARVGAEASQPLVIPATAALFTGRRSLVYVEESVDGGPTYAARVVRLGPRIGDHYPVVAGLNEGELIVTEGAFALDADLQIRGGASMMMGADDDSAGPYDQIITDLPTAFTQGLERILRPYLRMQEHLADDDLSGARESAGALVDALAEFTPSEPAAAAAALRPLARALREHAQEAADSESLEAARGSFEGLSERMAELLRVFGNPTEEPIRLAYCPMAAGSEGAYWLQTGDVVDNSYFGAAMLTCGEIRSDIEPGGFLEAIADQAGAIP